MPFRFRFSQKSDFRTAVAWLGGRDLLANIKYFALFALSNGKLDLRDWMNADVYPSDKKSEDELVEFWKKHCECADGEFWFDYFADSGDGMQATYSLAYLLLTDLFVKGPTDWAALSEDVRAEKLHSSGIGHDGEIVVFDTPKPKTDGKGQKLPRGAFLFVGGDTTYHVADYASLAERFVKPFEWAARDLYEHTGKDINAIDARPIFGIPGNHDYYDELDGFNRQFRKPITDEDKFLDLHGRNLPPQLRIPGFERFQNASYVALQLPFRWWLWGLDCEIKRLDLRQQEFFKAIGHASGNVPRKLIVATPEPTTVEGKRSPIDEKTAQAFVDVRLTQPFLYMPGSDTETQKPDNKARELREKDLGLNSYECRLDISGDTHHYTRYWGAEEILEDGVLPANYASVVSGGGGAAMSPTQVDVGEVPAQVKYPLPKVASRLVNEKLFSPIAVFMGGNVFAAGAVIAVLLYLAACVSPEHSEIVDRLLGGPLQRHGIIFTSWLEMLPSLRVSGLAIVGIWMIIAAIFYAKWVFDRLTKTYDLAYNFETNVEPDDSPRDLFTRLLEEIRGDSESSPSNHVTMRIWSLFVVGSVFVSGLFVLGYLMAVRGPIAAPSLSALDRIETGLILMAALSIGFSVVCMIFSHRTFKSVIAIGKNSLSADTKERVVEVYESLKGYVVGRYLDYLPFWVCSILGVTWLAIAIAAYRGGSSTWEAGTAVFFFLGLISVIVLLVGSIMYSAWLFRQSYRIQVTRFSYGPVIAYNVVAAGLLGAFVWLGGAFPLRTIVIDVTLILVVLLVLVGLVVLAMKVGNKKNGFRYGAFFFVFGTWHAILQLATPFLMIWLGGVAGAVTALLLVVLVANPLSRKLLVGLVASVEPHGLNNSHKKQLRRLAVTGLWFAIGIVFIVLPFFLKDVLPGWSYGFGSNGEHQFWFKALGAGMAAILGAILSCFWLGWYFAVSLLYNGHGNEAGSTARSEDYKQFIRFRITNDTLTGYVIGLDRVRENGALLKPRLIDVIHLERRPLEKPQPSPTQEAI